MPKNQGTVKYVNPKFFNNQYITSKKANKCAQFAGDSYLYVFVTSVNFSRFEG